MQVTCDKEPKEENKEIDNKDRCLARQMSKRTKNGIMFYHLEAGVTVVGPHLDSSRQLARKITLGVTSHQLGDSPKKSRWKCSSRICHDSEC